MRTRQLTTDHRQQVEHQYALRRGVGFWELTFAGRQAIFKHELGALYVACLLLDPPPEPIHAVALALKAKEKFVGQAFQPAGSWGFPAPPAGLGDSKVAGTGRLESLPYAAEVIQQRSMGLDDAAAVRALWRRQRGLERVLEDDRESEAVKAEALRELEEITEFLRKSPWRSRGGAERCVRAVAMAVRRFHSHLAGAVNVQGGPHPVLQAFAAHLCEHLLTPSGRGGDHRMARALSPFAGCYTYEPPLGVVWRGDGGRKGETLTR
jgi:hypothetical protein